MSRNRVILITLLLLLSTTLASAQIPSADSTATQEAAESRSTHSVPVVFWNREITVFRSSFGEMGPAERAAKAEARLAALPEVSFDWQITATESTSGQHQGAIIAVNGQFAFGILSEDLDQESGETLKAASDRATAQLRAALEARAQHHRWPTFLRALGAAVVATILLLVALWLLMLANRFLLRRVDATSSARPMQFSGFDLRPFLRSINRGLARLTVWAAATVLIYLWLTFVLLRFPYSQPWGQQLGSFLVNLFEKLGDGLLRAIPGLFTVVVIFLLTRFIVRLADLIFRRVEAGEVSLAWLHPDTARATRRLVIVLIWIFSVTVAYPYIPGSNTDAFKGVSVFVGLMVSLGSAGLINQVMSGLVVVYSKALRLGELVRVGEDIGTVTEIGMLSTKLLTRKREEITIPNAVLVGTKTTNYSRQSGEAGAGVGTTVTIGYDAPWRQVHAMLLTAAEQTAGIRKEPAPRVWQKSLSDFYVEYELEVHLDQPKERVPVLSELHTHIQDAFNEHGVQIMSPHFESQPDGKVFSPRSQWFARPSVPGPNSAPEE